MSSIATAVFKITIGLLVNKGRDMAAEKLKDGDVVDQRFRGLIVREIDDIKSKLDGLSKKDLLASISFFEEGIELLYQVFDKARITSNAATAQAACDEAFSLVKGMKKLELTGLDESATRVLSDAKKRFEDARREATKAFANEALKPADRILAMQYRVMATILEKIDNPEDAIDPCGVCLKDLNSLSAVQDSFNVQLKKGIKAWVGQDERRKIISSVCHVNHVIYDVTKTVRKDIPLLIWPAVDIGEEKVDLLRDRRLAEVLRTQDIEHCLATPWSLGQEGKQEHKLKNPRGIATNSSGQFIVGDNGDKDVKMFYSSGHFIRPFSLSNDDVETMLYILDVATDNKDNIYVLVKCEKKWTGLEGLVVYKSSNTAGLHQKFAVREEDWGDSLAVTSSKVLLSKLHHVAEYDNNGQFVRSFGKEVLKDAWDITATNDGRVMVVDRHDSCVHIFSEDGNSLEKFKLQGHYDYPRIAFQRESEHLVIAGNQLDEPGMQVEIFTKDGEFVRSTQTVLEEGTFAIRGMTVTKDGRIAVVVVGSKVLVI